MNIKALALSSLIAAGSIFAGTQVAKATECVYGEGYQLCMESIGYNNWNISVRNNYTTEKMTVQCYGKEVESWNSRGGFSQEEAQYVADYFCAL